MGRLARTPHSLVTSTQTKSPPVHDGGDFCFLKARSSVLRDDRSAEMIVHADARRVEFVVEAVGSSGSRE